ncbi:MAG: putative methylenetetrahydrofolate reductase [uncultured marine phage]|uniref:Putative methylenetetrahydrofolate reductase n=1 Tax=uncultured marine phage TaxID=707152 RepID=A0A8D9C9K8_9VIRU|nr:MAG: putative methylenetetrahydrofolate reductase [uncultured marine phage]
MSLEITTRNNIGPDISYNEIFVTWLPNESKESVIRKVKELFDKGYTPVPHIAAKKIKDRKEAYELSNELSKYSTKVLIIGGSGKQEGNFSTVKELVITGAFNNFKIGVGGFPDGNGSIPFEEGIQILRKKAKYADFVVTQWSLNKKSIKRFVDECPIPVYLGVPNKCSKKQLLKFAKLCGIRNSVKGFKSNIINMVRFMFGFNPRYIVNEFEGHNNVKKIHVYSFGNYDKL